MINEKTHHRLESKKEPIYVFNDFIIEDNLEDLLTIEERENSEWQGKESTLSLYKAIPCNSYMEANVENKSTDSSDGHE